MHLIFLGGRRADVCHGTGSEKVRKGKRGTHRNGGSMKRAVLPADQ